MTNFIALDAVGTPLAESTIQVINSSDALVVQRGMERQSYSCAPNCQPVERLGDDDKYLSNVAAQDAAHATRLSGAGRPDAAGPDVAALSEIAELVERRSDRLVVGADLGVLPQDAVDGGKHRPHVGFRHRALDDDDELGLVRRGAHEPPGAVLLR